MGWPKPERATASRYTGNVANDESAKLRRAGRPPIIEHGYHPERDFGNLGTGKWDQDSKAGRVLLAVRNSASRVAAANWAGLHRDTVQTWIQRGRDHEKDEIVTREDQPYVDFIDALTRAEGADEVDIVMLWRKQVATDWRAGRDLLARRHPERWGPRVEIEHAGSIQTDDSPTPTETVRRILADPVATDLALQLLHRTHGHLGDGEAAAANSG